MLLRFSLISGTPFAKFFLLKFFARYGNQMPWMDRVTEVIDAIGLPKSRFYEVVKELRALNVLEVQERNLAGTTQIRYQFDIGEQAMSSPVIDKQPLLHARKVEDLLALSSRPTSKRHQLTIPQRVLMIALLEEADAGGIIRNIGFSDLAERTGLKLRQIKNQMSKLREFHYVRVSLPGGNTAGLIGRYNSIHALNLRHPYFTQQRSTGGVIIFRQSAPFVPDEHLNYFHFLRRELLKGLSKQQRSPRAKVDHSDAILKLMGRAGDLRASSAWIFLNWLCHDLASKALSELWEELSELTAGELTTTISAKIRGEWLSVYRSTPEVDDDKNSGHKEAVRSKQPELSVIPLIEPSLSTAVRDIASGIKTALTDSKALPDNPEKYHFQILPIPHADGQGYFAMEVMARNEASSSQKNEFVLALGFEPKQGKTTVDNIGEIYSLKHSTLEMTGLASPPLTCPLLSIPPTRKREVVT